jgi:hypothetical protein
MFIFTPPHTPRSVLSYVVSVSHFVSLGEQNKLSHVHILNIYI